VFRKFSLEKLLKLHQKLPRLY